MSLSEDAARQVERLRRRLTEALDDLGEQGEPRGATDLEQQLLEELAVGIEELEVSNEELGQQRDALVSAQAALDGERRRYLDLFAGAPDPYVLTDLHGMIREANHAAAALLQVPTPRLAGKPLALYVRSDDVQVMHAILDAAARGAELRGRHLNLRPRGDEDTVPVEVSVAPERDPEDKVTGLLWLMRDVSEALRAAEEREALLAREQELARSLESQRDILRAVMDASHAHIAFLDTEFNFVHVNAAYVEGCGHPAEELIGRNHFELFPHPENEELFRQVRDTGEGLAFEGRPFEYADQPERGVTYWDWTLASVRTGGQVLGVVLSLIDVTERERRRQALEAHRDRLAKTIEVSRLAMQQVTVEAFLDCIAHGIRRLLSADVTQAAFQQRGDAQAMRLTAGDDAGDPCAVSDRRGATGYSGRALCPPLEGEGWRELFGADPTLRLGESDLRTRAKAAGLAGEHLCVGELLGARLGGEEVGLDGYLVAMAKRGSTFSPEDEALLAQLAAFSTAGLRNLESMRQAEDAAQTAAERADELDAIFGSMVDAVFMFDVQGRIAHVNPAGKLVLGHDPAGTRGADLASRIALVSADGQPVPYGRLASTRALRGERVRGERFRLRLGADGWRAVLVSAGPVWRGDRVIGAVVVWHDITDRERLTERLKEERARLRATEARIRVLLDAWQGAALLVDADGTVLTANSGVQAIYGLSPDQAVGSMYLDIIPQEVRDDRALQLAQCLGSNATLSSEHRVGPQIYTASLYPVHDGGERANAVAVFVRDVTEERQAQETLRRREQEFRALVENSPDVVVRVSSALRLTYANPTAVRLLGQSAEELVNQRCVLLNLPSEVLESLSTAATEVLQTGEERSVEFSVPRADSSVYYDTRLTPEFSADGAVESALVIARDITERQRARQALGLLARRLQMLHTLDQAILAAHTMEEVAEAGLENLAALVPFHRGSVSLYDIVAGEGRMLAVHTATGASRVGAGARHAIENVYLMDSLARGEVVMTADLNELPLEGPVVDTLRAEGVRAHVAVPLIAEGELLGSLNIGLAEPGAPPPEAVDIAREVADELAIGIRQAMLHNQVTRHAQVLEQTVARRTSALRISEARFRAIYEESPLGIAVLDERSQISSANASLEEMLGYATGELVGRAFSSLLHADEPYAQNGALREFILGRRLHRRSEMRMRDREDHLVWVEIAIAAVRGRRGQTPFAMVVIDDITEQKQVLAAMVNSEKMGMTGKLAAALSHEINNPLQAVIGCLGLAQESLDAGEPSVTSQYLGVGLAELRRASRIVSQLRDVQRPSREEDRRPHDLRGILEHALQVTDSQYLSRGVRVAVEGPDQAVASVVRDGIVQVFLNLLLNAYDAMPHGGDMRITLSPTVRPRGMRIEFSDTGSGIAPEDLPRVFDLFFSRNPESLGVGLFVTQNVVQQHGGYVEVQSEPGVGSTFTVWLPIEPPLSHQSRSPSGH